MHRIVLMCNCYMDVKVLSAWHSSSTWKNRAEFVKSRFYSDLAKCFICLFISNSHNSHREMRNGFKKFKHL